MMQQRGCEEMPLLISKYVDDAASPEERELVDRHVAACQGCSCKLTEYMEIAALFSESPMFVPEVQVRQGVFREIEHIKREEERSKVAKESPRGWFSRPATRVEVVPVRAPSFALRLMRAASPFAAASIGIMAIFSLVLLTDRTPISNVPEQNLDVLEVIYPPVPTIPAALAMYELAPPVSTRAASMVGAPSPSVSAPVRATATLGRPAIVRLASTVPVLEDGSPSKTSTWHVTRDPAFGYTISYPPNWWTQVRGNTRFFFPWGIGTRDAPYYLDMRVEENVKGLTAETANLTGSCTLKRNEDGTLCLRRSSFGREYSYDELYSFDAKHIYVLRLTVPGNSDQGSFNARWDEAQNVLWRMSASVSLSPSASQSENAEPVLFLNGTDLWSVRAGGEGAQPVTRGYGVRQFALSPDSRTVAFVSNEYLYLTKAGLGSYAEPVHIWSGLSIQDIAWYSDRRLLALANVAGQGFGLYRLLIPAPGVSDASVRIEAQLLTKLSDTMSGAKSLAISPDRQLITLMAPVAENKGTDIYAVRPDGSDLRKLISHREPLSPIVDGQRVLPAEDQAIKSYLWTDGRLEKAGYEFNMLFTSGNSSSPSLYRGGYLYSAAGASRGPLLDPHSLGVADPNRLQIIHLAYSNAGRVAFTGYYNDYLNRAEYLAGLWTADLLDGVLANITAQPLPERPRGITNLQWSPDGLSLIYRETIPALQENFISRYDGVSDFVMVKLNPSSGQRQILYSNLSR